jgi:PhnB protein
MNQRTDRASSSTAHAITPDLVVGGAAQAADWYQQAFGAQVGPGSRCRAASSSRSRCTLGDARVMLADEFPEMGCCRR